MNTPGINVKPEVARNRIFCSCCGGDLDVDEVVRSKSRPVLLDVGPVGKKEWVNQIVWLDLI